MGARLASFRASALLSAAALLILAARGMAVDEVLPDVPPLPQVLLDPQFGIELRAAGRGAEGTSVREAAPVKPPFAAAKTGAWWVRWDDYRTLIVIEESAGLLRPAWVVTLVAVNGQGGTQGQVVVAYRAQAYRDKDGTLHIDAHHAVLTGTMAPSWSPDSFALGTDKQVTTHDDNPDHDSNAGVVEKEIPGGLHAEEYRTLLRGAQSIIEDNL